jgi:hypothetical protein
MMASLRPTDEVTVVAAGADDAVQAILDSLAKKNSHYLAVFDPYAFKQGSWESYGRLISNTPRGDLLITFQTSMVKRTSEKQRKAFFGPAYDPGIMNMTEDKILEWFKETCLRPHRPIVDHVRVRASGAWGRYYYDLVYCVARTAGGNPFMKAFGDVRRRVESLTGETIQDMLKNKGLDRFNS